MKKNITVFAVLLLCVAVLGACSRGNNAQTEPETTVAETTEAEEEEEEEEEEEPEEDSLSGTVVSMNDDEVTVLSYDDDNEYRFDISEAEIISQYPLSEGDDVYVEYYVGNLNPKTAIIYEVEDAYLASFMDPFITGTVLDSTSNSVSILADNEEEYTFYTPNAYIVTDDGIKPGVNVEITYIGEPDDDPYAIKVVTEECFGTPAAGKNGFVGNVAEVGDDQIILISEDEDYFTFVSDDLDFDNFDVDDKVLVIYNGIITDKEIPALEISGY